MNNHNRRNKPGPKLSLSGFFSGPGGATPGGKVVPNLSPSQLKPTRIIDTNPPLPSSETEVIRTFGGVRVTAVVRHQHAQSPETAAAEHEQEQDQAVSAVTDATTDGDGAKNLAYLPPLKYIITFPPPSSSSASTFTSTSKETLTTLLQTIANDPTANVEIQCLRPLLPGNGGLGQQTALSDAEWQELGDLVDGISRFGEGGVGVDGDEDGGGDGKKAIRRRRILISGILPPPIDPTYPSARLHTSPAYVHTYLPRLTELSLNAAVLLKLLPPVVDGSLAPTVAGGEEEREGEGKGKGEGEGKKDSERWWTDEEELKRVMRLYVTPAMECFGSHRIIFGSSPIAVLNASTISDCIHSPSTTTNALITPERWYVVAKTVVSELVCGSGDAVEAQGEMDDVFFGNASRIWGGA